MTKAKLQAIIDAGVSDALVRSRKATKTTTKMAPADGQTRKLTLAERNAILSRPGNAVKAAAIMNSVDPNAPKPTAEQIRAERTGNPVFDYLRAVRKLQRSE